MGLKALIRQSANSNSKLLAAYDRSSKIISIYNSLPLQWAYTINIDNQLTIDLDAEGWVANIDVFAKPRLNHAIIVPHKAKRGSVQFAIPASGERFIPNPIVVETDQARRLIRISLDPTNDPEQGQWLKTSEQVYLQINADLLRTIVIDFGTKGLWD
ncbi:MAG: hypothetical protein LCH85_17200 [Chloroflexi bacterium]|nr:hypothetical protein [Chloroflexota bacterium]